MPFLLTGLGINQFLSFYKNFRQHLHKVEVVSGVVLILVGVLVMSGQSTLLTSSKLTAWLPNWEGSLKLDQPTPPAPGPVANTNFELAPDVEFQTLAGKPFRLKELQGQVVLLNFWATYCIPCREEIPALNALQHELQAQGLKIVGASLDDSVDGVNAYQQEVAKFEYEVLLGGSDAKVKFAQSVLPTTYLIDRQGRIVKRSSEPETRRVGKRRSSHSSPKRLQLPAPPINIESFLGSNTMKKLLILSILAFVALPSVARAQGGHEYSPLVEKDHQLQKLDAPQSQH